MSSNQHAHLEMIQAIINRLAQNSFLLKGWNVVLVSALFALSASQTNPVFVILAYFPAAAFWILDGYFLWQERLFCALYDHVRVKNETEIDFSMNVGVVMSTVDPWHKATFSKTLLIFHGAVFGSIVIVMFIILVLNKGGS